MLYSFYQDFKELIMLNIQRINELAKKSKTVGLTKEEKIEQQIIVKKGAQGSQITLQA